MKKLEKAFRKQAILFHPDKHVNKSEEEKEEMKMKWGELYAHFAALKGILERNKKSRDILIKNIQLYHHMKVHGNKKNIDDGELDITLEASAEDIKKIISQEKLEETTQKITSHKSKETQLIN